MARKNRPKPSRARRITTWSAAGFVLALVLFPYALRRPPDMPAGTDVRTPSFPLADGQARLLVDSTTWDTNTQERVFRHEIFDACLDMIRNAERFIYIDFFLWNNWQGKVAEHHRQLATELADALARRKAEIPAITVLVFTDPINRIYGGHAPGFMSKLAARGITVVFTDLGRLRYSNPLYSAPADVYGGALARLDPVARWLDAPRFENPFQQGGAEITARELARMLHFRANHRKVVITDGPGGARRMLVTSFNPADGSSAHSNVGLLLEGPLAAEALRAELQCVEWSAASPDNVLGGRPGTAAGAIQELRALLPGEPSPSNAPPDGPRAAWLSEQAVRRQILSILDQAGPGDQVRIALFYLSDPDVVRSIRNAAYGGAMVRVILDPNRDAFGRIKNGVPNRPVAAGLTAYARAQGVKLDVRWADTHGEQFHTKAMSVMNRKENKYQFICGSANWTRRNLQDLNLEANVYVERDPGLVGSFNDYFDRAWSNTDGLSHTVPYEAFAATGWTLLRKRLLYRFQERTGLCTF